MKPSLSLFVGVLLIASVRTSPAQQSGRADSALQPMSNAEVLLRSVLDHPELWTQYCFMPYRPKSLTIQLGGIPGFPSQIISRAQYTALREQRDSVILAFHTLPDNPLHHLYQFSDDALRIICNLNAVELLPELVEQMERHPRAVKDAKIDTGEFAPVPYYPIASAVLVLLHQEGWRVRPVEDSTAEGKDVYDYVREAYDKEDRTRKGSAPGNYLTCSVELERDIVRIAREFLRSVPEGERKGEGGMTPDPTFR